MNEQRTESNKAIENAKSVIKLLLGRFEKIERKQILENYSSLKNFVKVEAYKCFLGKDQIYPVGNMSNVLKKSETLSAFMTYQYFKLEQEHDYFITKIIVQQYQLFERRKNRI